MLHYFWMETGSLEMLSRPEFLTMYKERIQAPSLSDLPVPRQYGRQGCKDGISPLLHYSAHLPSKRCFHLELPKLAKMSTAWPGHIQPHLSTGCAVFHEHRPAVVNPVTKIPWSPWLGLPPVPKRRPMPFPPYGDVQHL